jgi:hypothetical protein
MVGSEPLSQDSVQPMDEAKLEKHLAELQKRVETLESLKTKAIGIAVGVSLVLAVAGISLSSFVKTEVRKQVSGLVEEIVNKVVQEELPKSIDSHVEKVVQREFGRRQETVEQLVENQVDAIIPTSVKLEWVVRQLGGSWTYGSGKRIERIDLTDTNITDDDLARLCSQADIDAVKFLVLRNNTKVTIKGISAVAKLPSLLELNISGTHVSPADAQSILRHVAVVSN